MIMEDSNHSSWLCGTCDNPVTWENKGVVCEKCGQWFHDKCQSINSVEYNLLDDSDVSWYCAICGNPNSKTAFDLYGIDQTMGSSAANQCSNGESFSIGDEINFTPNHSSTPTRSSQQNKWKDRPLRILTVNFQSVSSKKAEIPHLLETMKPDIILGSETWLKENIANGAILPKCYNVYRNDREDGWGGVLIAVHNSLDSCEVQELKVTDCEIVWAKIKLQGRRTLYVAAYYRPDKSDTLGLSGFTTSVRRASQIPNSYLLIGGDFNLPGINWKTISLKPDCKYVQNHRDFLDTINDFGLDQMVTEPTHDDNTLDLILTNSPHLIPRVEIIPGLCKHEIPFCEFSIKARRTKPVIRDVPMFKKADWGQIRKAASELSEKILFKKESHTNDLWILFRDGLNNIVNKCVPHRTIRPKSHLPWVTPSLKKQISQKNKLYRRMKTTGREDLKEQLRNLNRDIQRQMRRNYWDHLNDVCSEKPSNKRLYAFIKSQKTSNIGVAPLKRDGRLESDPQQQAEILNDQFKSVFGEGENFTQEQFIQKTNMPDPNCPVMPDIHVTQKGVNKLLRDLNPYKASGPDGISSYVLKELADELSPGLTTIYQSSLNSGVVPSDWRSAFVSPIFKKGEQYNPANYRPISLTCIACKILEHVIVSSMMKHLEAHSILNDRQHGFRSGRSCETQLLEFAEELVSNIEAGKQTDALIMDFAKAFDKVNHSLLTHKLWYYGIQGSCHTWIENFLKSRTQSVVVAGTRSSMVNVKSGVPQGSVLGPCLFLVYINDLPDRLTAQSRLFADDTVAYSTVDNSIDQQQLQDDLNHLTDWEQKWDMKFHPEKCVSLSITRKTNPLVPSYQLHSHTLENASQAKYLGVTINNKMTWDMHTTSIINKANKSLGLLRRSLKISSTTIKAKAYNTYVRPQLEYAATVWDCHTQKTIDLIEAVQKRAARFVLRRHRNTSSVTDMLESLKWPSLKVRRKRARLTMLYKIQHQIVHCPIIHGKLEPAPERIRRGHKQQLKLLPFKTNYRRDSFLPTTIREWNSLPNNVVDAATVDSFVARLARVT